MVPCFLRALAAGLLFIAPASLPAIAAEEPSVAANAAAGREEVDAKRARRWYSAGAEAGGLVVAGITVEAPWRADAEIAKFARDATRGQFTTPEKVKAIKEAILGLRRLNLRYEATGSVSAVDAFRTRAANCLGFTNLFIAMARTVGVEAFYVEVADVDEFARQDEFVVNNRHICAGYWSSSGFGVIDFVERPPFTPRYRPVSDLAGLAHYYNNRGCDFLRAKDFSGAERNLQVALAVQPKFAWARNNLGVALGRMERTDEAQAQYRRAISDDPRYGPAYANLASLLASLGQGDEAASVYESLSRVKSRDPFSQYQAGLFALGRGDFETALKRLHRSASLDPSLPEVQIGIAEASLGLGDRHGARRAYERALALDPDNMRAQIGLDRLAATAPASH